MTKLTISEAARRFQVSRPTLRNHLKNGKISGEIDTDKTWKIDASELARAYQPRGEAAGNRPAEIIAPPSNALHDDLKAEIELLKAKLAGAEALAEERAKHNEQLSRLIEAPKKRRIWPWG